MRMRSRTTTGAPVAGALMAGVLVAGALGLAGCGAAAAPAAAKGTVAVVAAENEYGDVAAQVGGRYVTVTSVESNPNTDPHTYEVSPSVAGEVAGARLVIQNGVGYDAFMDKVESASPSSSRQTIDVQDLLGLPDDTPNPHLWYRPSTMPAVADRIAADLAHDQPAHAAYFRHNAAVFVASLHPWLAAIAHFRATYPGTPVATTEPVGDYMLEAAGTDDLTPFGLQAAIMNGTDPTPQDVSLEDGFFAHHDVKVFVYNQQVTDSLTAGFEAAAIRDHIPVVGVYETMPTPGYHYQSWMLAEVDALERAVADHASTEKL
jgi:zinc/manganese transport system substrate-binding protein